VDDELERSQVTEVVTHCNTSAVTELVTSPIYIAQTMFLIQTAFQKIYIYCS